MTIFLLQHSVLQPLHTFVHCFAEPPPPSDPHDETEAGRHRLLQQLRPMLHGEHHLEEILWQEDLDRPALLDMLQAYDGKCLTCFVTPDPAAP